MTDGKHGNIKADSSIGGSILVYVIDEWVSLKKGRTEDTSSYFYFNDYSDSFDKNIQVPLGMDSKEIAEFILNSKINSLKEKLSKWEV